MHFTITCDLRMRINVKLVWTILEVNDAATLIMKAIQNLFIELALVSMENFNDPFLYR